MNRLLLWLGIGSFDFREGPLLQRMRRHWFTLAVALLVLVFVFRHLLDVRIGWRGGGGSEKRHLIEKDGPPQAAQGSLLPLADNPVARGSKILEQLRSMAASKREAFVKRFGPIAQKESRKFGTPASVILGSAMIHSLAGTTAATLQANNIFSISCGLNPLREGVVGQFDAEGQCMTAYENHWTSFRAHSVLLSRPPLSEIAQRAGKDPSKWAEALSVAGYSAVPDFATVLLSVIEENGLKKWDR